MAKAAAAPATAPDAAVYPIREAARASGVNPVTLRAWERRYGLLRPRRSSKGHRLYAAQDIERVRRIVALIEAGIPVGRVRAVLDGGNGAAHARQDAGGLDALRDALRGAAQRFAPGALDAALGRGLTELPLDLFYRRVLEPVRGELEQAAGERGEAAGARALLDARAEQRLASILGARAGREPAGPEVWFAGLPQEREALAILAHALAAVEAGLRAVALTAPVPPAALAGIAGRGGIAAVVVIGRSGALAASAERGLRALGAEAGTRAFVGGPAAVMGEDVFPALGLEVLPPTPAAAARRLRERTHS